MFHAIKTILFTLLVSVSLLSILFSILQSMINFKIPTSLLVILLVCFQAFIPLQDAFAQSRAELEQQRKQLREEIKYTQQMLERTRRTRTESLEELETLQRQIQIREELIKNIHRDLQMLENQIEELNDVVSALERDLEGIREEYARLVVHAYRNRSSLNTLMYVFAADNFNAAFQRARYIREISGFRQKQAKMIQETQRSLSTRIEKINTSRAEKEELLSEQTSQNAELNRERNRQDNLVRQLRTEERKLQQKIVQKEKATEQLNKAIEEIIKREIEEARRRAERERREGENVLNLTPEAAQLSADFNSNMGKLPWPVERGVITSSFGTHNHPVLPGVRITNNGINIRTEPNSRVRALFNGTVASVIFNPSFQHAVLIRHGEYFTVYSQLEEVFVRSGQEVSTRQDIGLVYTDESDQKTEVHLEIWQGTKKLNPALWLYNQ